MIKWDDYWLSYTVSKAERWLILERDKIINKYLNMIEDSPKNIIEVGCGYGSNLSLIKEARDDVECYALDNSEVAIEKIKERIPNTVLADCLDTKLPDNKFDIIYSAGLMEHFKDESPFLNEMKRILKERGYLITFIPARYSLWQLYQLFHLGSWQHGYEKSFTYNSLEKLFKENNFIIDEIVGSDPFSINGFIMKLFNVSFNPLMKKSLIKSGYQELCLIARKN